MSSGGGEGSFIESEVVGVDRIVSNISIEVWGVGGGGALSGSICDAPGGGPTTDCMAPNDAP